MLVNGMFDKALDGGHKCNVLDILVLDLHYLD